MARMLSSGGAAVSAAPTKQTTSSHRIQKQKFCRMIWHPCHTLLSVHLWENMLIGWCSRDCCTPWEGGVGMARMPYPPIQITLS